MENKPIFCLNELYDIIKDRYDRPITGSYTNALFDMGEDEILKKVGEEAVELILAAKVQGNARLIEETADLAYHILVLLVERGISPKDVQVELERRQR
jgi:phosphoribosyl-ATP pyrophosphohydrolase